MPFDAAKPGSADAAVAGTLQRHGKLDIPIRNVGGSVREPSTSLTEDEWQAVLTTGVTAG